MDHCKIEKANEANDRERVTIFGELLMLTFDMHFINIQNKFFKNG